MDIKIAVCDDEKETRCQIERSVHALLPQARTVLFEDARTLLQNADGLDIIFLDIRMAGLDGMTAARKLRKNGSGAVLIFVTALEEYVFEAFDVGAFHYLVKPFDKVKFCEVLQRAVCSCHEQRAERHSGIKEPALLCIKTGTVTEKVYLDEIVYIEVFNRKCTLHKTNGTIEFYAKISDLEKKLGKDFFRTHRSCLIHLKYVFQYNSDGVTMEDGTRVLLAKKRYAAFVSRYMQYADC